MNSPNFDNHSENSSFKTFKHFLHKYCPRFSKICKNSMHLNQFLVLLYDCLPNFRHFLSIHKLLKNANVSQFGTGRNPTTALYSEITNPDFFDKSKKKKEK